MIPQSARQFNDILKQEDILNEKYYEQLEKINWLILITPERLYKLIYTSLDEVEWVCKTRVLYIDSKELVWKVLDTLVKQYGVSVQENA